MPISHDDAVEMSVEELYEKKKKLQHIVNAANQQIRELRATRSEAELEGNAISRELLRRAERQMRKQGGV